MINHTKEQSKDFLLSLNLINSNNPKEILNNFATFTQAKFAEPMMARNNQYFYMDILLKY